MTKTVNADAVCDLDAQPKIPLNIFKFKKFLFGVTNIVENNDKENWVYSGYGIVFDGADSWNFDNEFA